MSPQAEQNPDLGVRAEARVHQRNNEDLLCALTEVLIAALALPRVGIPVINGHPRDCKSGSVQCACYRSSREDMQFHTPMIS